jgi:HTH-type transcriptional regulator/antitoxin HipB
MVDTFPVSFPGQLRQHLRALRKRRGLTQAQLGALIGVSQARIAEIEANPGLVNFEQLMRLLAVLGVSLTLQESTAAPATSVVTAKTSKARPGRPHPKVTSERPEARTGSQRSLVIRPKKGSW